MKKPPTAIGDFYFFNFPWMNFFKLFYILRTIIKIIISFKNFIDFQNSIKENMNIFLIHNLIILLKQ
ncbi:hypothetical protein ACXX84_04125, partial [Mycoplasma sp. AC157]